MQTTTLDTPKQNNVTKKKNRTFVENVRYMLQHMKLDHRFWAKTMVTTRYIHNRIFRKIISNMTPREVWCGYKLSISHFCVFLVCCICSCAKLGNKDKVGFQRCQMHMHWLL
jgi:hypothetical protein